MKEAYDGKSGNDFVKLKFNSYTTSIMLAIYDFRMALFDHGYPE